jgi:hypothetical protein
MHSIPFSVSTLSFTHNPFPLSMKTSNQMILFRKIIAIYSENHTKHINMDGLNADSSNVKAGGTHSYH